jgi:large subunit ribosomal protein L46
VIKAGVVITRRPIILRDLTPIEAAYSRYREERDAQSTLPFQHDFYFKKGSLAEKEFFKARGLKQAHNLDDSEGIDTEEDGLVKCFADPTEIFSERTTEADGKNDLTSLNRKLQNHLFLVVKSKESDKWHFPTENVTKQEFLHEVLLSPYHHQS